MLLDGNILIPDARPYLFTGHLQISGAKKLGCKGSDIRVSASKRVNSPIISPNLEYKVLIEGGGQYQAHRLFLP